MKPASDLSAPYILKRRHGGTTVYVCDICCQISPALDIAQVHFITTHLDPDKNEKEGLRINGKTTNEESNACNNLESCPKEKTNDDPQFLETGSTDIKSKFCLRQLTVDMGRRIDAQSYSTSPTSQSSNNKMSQVDMPQLEPFMPLPLTNPKRARLYDYDLSDKEYQERKLWLKYMREPQSMVKQYLDETFTKRRKEIYSVGLNPIEWPCFFHSNHLINQEFTRLYPAMVVNHIYTTWTEPVSRKILKFCADSSMAKHLPDSWEELEGDALYVYAAMVLPFLCDCQRSSLINEGNKRKRHFDTITDASYFAEIFPRKTIVSVFCESENIRNQPFLVILGDEVKRKFSKFYIMAERNVISCTSILEAIDTCFKLFYVMNAEFPLAVQGAWDFISSFFYDMTEPNWNHIEFANYLRTD